MHLVLYEPSKAADAVYRGVAFPTRCHLGLESLHAQTASNGNAGTSEDRMFAFFTIIISLQAQADTSVPAATLLSRFPAGGVPALPVVLTAINTLSNTRSAEHIPLLRSLSDQESILVSMAADVAIAQIEGTHQDVAESDFKLEDALADLIAAELTEEHLPEESGP